MCFILVIVRKAHMNRTVLKRHVKWLRANHVYLSTTLELMCDCTIQLQIPMGTAFGCSSKALTTS
jgi:hypothetical protein